MQDHQFSLSLLTLQVLVTYLPQFLESLVDIPHSYPVCVWERERERVCVRVNTEVYLCCVCVTSSLWKGLGLPEIIPNVCVCTVCMYIIQCVYKEDSVTVCIKEDSVCTYTTG